MNRDINSEIAVAIGDGNVRALASLVVELHSRLSAAESELAKAVTLEEKRLRVQRERKQRHRMSRDRTGRNGTPPSPLPSPSSPTPLITTSFPPTPGTTSAPAKTARVAPWLLPSSRIWEARFGEGSFPWGEFGKHCKALAKAHAPPVIADHLRRYLAKTDTQYVSPARFAKTFGEYAPVDANAIVDEFGCLTEYGEKVTRPQNLKLA